MPPLWLGPWVPVVSWRLCWRHTTAGPSTPTTVPCHQRHHCHNGWIHWKPPRSALRTWPKIACPAKAENWRTHLDSMESTRRFVDVVRKSTWEILVFNHQFHGLPLEICPSFDISIGASRIIVLISLIFAVGIGPSTYVYDYDCSYIISKMMIHKIHIKHTLYLVSIRIQLKKYAQRVFSLNWRSGLLIWASASWSAPMGAPQVKDANFASEKDLDASIVPNSTAVWEEQGTLTRSQRTGAAQPSIASFLCRDLLTSAQWPRVIPVPWTVSPVWHIHHKQEYSRESNYWDTTASSSRDKVSMDLGLIPMASR